MTRSSESRRALCLPTQRPNGSRECESRAAPVKKLLRMTFKQAESLRPPRSDSRLLTKRYPQIPCQQLAPTLCSTARSPGVLDGNAPCSILSQCRRTTKDSKRIGQTAERIGCPRLQKSFRGELDPPWIFSCFSPSISRPALYVVHGNLQSISST